MAENPLKNPPSDEVARNIASLWRIKEMVQRRKEREREKREFNKNEMERLLREMAQGPHPWDDPSDPHNW
jgi:hypothetical protein